MKIPESEVVKACLEYLQIRGVFAWRHNSGALRDKNNRPVFFGKAGSSDIIGVLPGGRFIAVECKAQGGYLSDQQSEFLARVEMMGGLAVVARSVEDIEKALGGNYGHSEIQKDRGHVLHPVRRKPGH